MYFYHPIKRKPFCGFNVKKLANIMTAATAVHEIFKEKPK